jgi:hypothetical protein
LSCGAEDREPFGEGAARHLFMSCSCLPPCKCRSPGSRAAPARHRRAGCRALHLAAPADAAAGPLRGSSGTLTIFDGENGQAGKPRLPNAINSSRFRPDYST